MQQYAELAEAIRGILQEAIPNVEVSTCVMPNGIEFRGKFRDGDQTYGCAWQPSVELLRTPDEARRRASYTAMRWAQQYAHLMNSLTPQDSLSGYSQTKWHEIPVSEISPEAFGFLGD